MGWKVYKLVYQAKSPIHIGWHTLGYIKLTRYYIIGKAMWGAFTANLKRSGQGDFEYQDYGNFLKKDVLLSYFYPATETESELQLQFMLPKYTKEGLMHYNKQNKRYGKEKFERLFISSFGQTAILPETNTKEDESLHESEFIMPEIEDKKVIKQVYFIGYLFIKDGASIGNSNKEVGWEGKNINLKEPFSEIFVGGDRKYGWGRLVLDPGKIKEENNMFGFSVNPDKDKPEVTIPSGHPVPAHTSINQDLRIKGDIEPLVGRDWGEVMNEDGKKKVGFGQQISRADICWMPGSVLMEETTFNIGEYGILQKKETKDG